MGLPDGAGPSGLSRVKRLGFLAKDVAFYGGASAVNKLFALVTFPLLTRYFSVAEYGLIDYLTFVTAFLATLIVLGQDSAVARYYYDHDSAAQRRRVISQSLALQVGLTLVAIAGLIAVLAWLPLPAAVREQRLLLLLVLLHLPFLVLTNFAQNILKWTFSRREFAVVSLGQAGAYAGALVVAVVVFHASILAVFAVSLATRVVFGLLGLYFCRGWIERPRDATFLRPLLSFGIPFGIIGSIGAFVPVMERSSVAAIIGTSALGLYAAGAAVAMLVTLPLAAFQTAWGPFFLAIHKEKDAHASYNHALKAFAVVMCVAVFGLAVAAPMLLRVLTGGGFEAGLVVIFPLAMGVAIQGISWVTEIGVGISKKAHLQLCAYAAFLGVAALLVWGLAPRFGILGVATAVLLAHTAKALVASWLAQRAYPLPWAYRPILILLAVTVVLGVVHANVFARWGTWAGLLFGAVGLSLLLTVSWRGVLDRDERRKILALAGQGDAASPAVGPEGPA